MGLEKLQFTTKSITFFNAVEIITNPNGKMAEQWRNFFTEENISTDENIFGDNLPDEVIIASGSIRKAVMALCLLNDVTFPFEKSDELLRYFSENIYNGDGQLAEKTFLGYLGGAPVYAESAADGEGEGNDPDEQAKNKVRWLAQKYEKKNVLLVSTDTVDFPDKNDDGFLPKGEMSGKPENEKNFPGYSNKFKKSGNRLLSWIGEKVQQFRLWRFSRNFIFESYPKDVSVIHINAIAVLNALQESDLKVISVILQAEFSEVYREIVELYFDCGGGGIIQQVIDWESETLLQDIGDELAKSTLAEKDKEALKWILICQVMGMPWWAVIHAIENYVGEDQN